jgi:hypothetical protein
LDDDLKMDESLKDLMSFKNWDTAKPQDLADILVKYSKTDDSNAEEKNSPKLFAAALKGILLRKLSSRSFAQAVLAVSDGKAQLVLEKLPGEVAEIMQETKAILDVVGLEDEY